MNDLNIALSAFSCQPDAGSEARSGWQWATGLAEAGFDVTVYTWSQQRDALADVDVPGLRFRFVDGQWPRLAEMVPPYRSSLAYLDFLRNSSAVIARDHASRRFDAGVHVSWSQLRSGTGLAEVDDLPFIFGPVGGGQIMPLRAAVGLGGLESLAELARSVHVKLTPLSRRARRTCERAALVLAANRETADLASRMGATSVQLMLDGGVSPESATQAALPPLDEGLRLLWVGRLMPRKQVGLALDALRIARRSADVRLTVVGDGADASLLSAPIDGVEWRGQVPPEELPAIFAAHHALLFTSMRESGAPPVIESAGFGRPVITVDHHGPAVAASEAFARLVEVRPYSSLAERLAAEIVALAADPQLLRSLAAGCLVAREELLQPARVRRLADELRRVASAS